MVKPATRETLEVDDTIIDLLVHDNQADQTPEEIQLVHNINRVQLFCLIDPYTGLIMPYRLSYEEREMKSDQ